MSRSITTCLLTLLVIPQEVDKVLEPFGLAVASSYSAREDDRDSDTDRYVPITIPLLDYEHKEVDPRHHAELDATIVHIFGEDASRHAIISPNIFSTPMNTTRFKELVSLYRLEVVTNCEMKLHGVVARPAEATAPLNEGSPQWRLWTTVTSCG